MIKIILFCFSCAAYLLAVILIGDIYIKIDSYSIDVAAVARQTMGRLQQTGAGCHTLAFFVTLMPWLLVQGLSFFLVSARNLNWALVSVLYSVLGSCWLSSMDAIIGRPPPMGKLVQEDGPWLFFLTVCIFFASEIFVFMRKIVGRTGNKTMP